MQARKSTCRVICWGFPIDLSSFAMHFLFYSYSSLRINRSPPSSPFLSSKGEPSNFKCTRERNGNRAIPQTQTLPPSPPPLEFQKNPLSSLWMHTWSCSICPSMNHTRWKKFHRGGGARGSPPPTISSIGKIVKSSTLGPFPFSSVHPRRRGSWKGRRERRKEKRRGGERGKVPLKGGGWLREERIDRPSKDRLSFEMRWAEDGCRALGIHIHASFDYGVPTSSVYRFRGTATATPAPQSSSTSSSPLPPAGIDAPCQWTDRRRRNQRRTCCTEALVSRPNLFNFIPAGWRAKRKLNEIPQSLWKNR